MTQYPELFAALAAPFGDHEVKTRAAQGGRTLHYITARTAMNRLDIVLGPENWWDEYHPGANSVLCKLTIRLADGSTVTKADAGGYAGMADQGDDDKSGFSDAFKRAAAKFGVGRYLYRDGVPEYAPTPSASGLVATAAEPVSLAPQPASPSVMVPAPAPVSSPAGAPPSRAPRTGRALFAWAKEQEARHGVGILRYLNQWGKLRELPGRMVEWEADHVADAYLEAVRKIEAAAAAGAESYEEAIAN
jgi:hypothetical protein